MSPFVLDCSATIAFFFRDETSPYTDAVFEALTVDARAVVPIIWPLEVLNVCLTAERKKRIKADEVMQILTILEKFPIEVEESSAHLLPGGVLTLAREHNLSSYDAAYLELAVRSRFPLATLDKKLRQAARKAGISIWSK